MPKLQNSNIQKGNLSPPRSSLLNGHSNGSFPVPVGSLARNRRQSSMSVSTSVQLDAFATTPSVLVWQITLVASVSGLMFGYDTGYIASVLVNIGTDLDGKMLSTKQMEVISAATSMGALLAAMFAGVLVDLIGRKFTVILCDLLFIVGALVQFLSGRVSSMVLGRLIMGVGVGIGSLCSPLYISELSPGKFRGSLVVVNCLAITGGQLIAYAIGAWLSGVVNGWRMVVLISIVPSILQMVAISFLPDTPRYLIMVRRFEKAREVLKKIYPNSTDELIEANIEELNSMNNIWSNESGLLNQVSKSWDDLISIKSNKRALIIGCGLQLIQQFSGFNALMYFSASIFKMVGYENSTSVSCFIAGTNFITTCIAIVIIDKVGRRKILLCSLPLLMIAQLICAIAFIHLDLTMESPESLSPIWRWVLVYSMIGFVAFYAIGIGNVPWQQSELFPQNVRGLGSSISTCCNWGGSMVISISFLSLMETLTPSGTFILFSTFTLASWIFIYLTYPELGGLTLEEVEEILDQSFKDGIDYSLKLRENRVIWERPMSDGSAITID